MSNTKCQSVDAYIAWNPGSAFMEPLTIETPRLRLRRLVAEDAEWVWQLDQDPEVMRFISGGQTTPRDVFQSVLLPRLLREYPEGPQFGFWSASCRDPGDGLEGGAIGWFHVRPERREPYEMELGYRLSRNVWVRGLATEGSRVLLRHAFEEWGLPCVVAQALSANVASRRVMEKCGMRWESDFVYPADWVPGLPEGSRKGVRYAIKASDSRALDRTC